MLKSACFQCFEASRRVKPSYVKLSRFNLLREKIREKFYTAPKYHAAGFDEFAEPAVILFLRGSNGEVGKFYRTLDVSFTQTN